MSDVIPASDVVEADGQLVVIVDGECSGHCGPNRDCTGVVADLPAWVTEAMEPCETCKGIGCFTHWYVRQDCDRDCCPDCHHGRRVIEIETSCSCCGPDDDMQGTVSHRVVVTDVIDVRNRIEFKTKIARWHELDALPGQFAVICEKVTS